MMADCDGRLSPTRCGGCRHSRYSIVRSSGGAGLFANALEENAARLAGIRQTLRDAVVAMQRESRPFAAAADGNRRWRRSIAGPEQLSATGFAPGPGPIGSGWRSGFAKTYHPSSMTRVLRRTCWIFPPGRRRGRCGTRGRDRAQERFKKAGAFATGLPPRDNAQIGYRGPTSSPPCARTPATTSPW